MQSQSQRRIFEQQVLRPVLDSYKKAAQELCGFMALRGSRYDNKLMVVGRAVNRWGCGKSISDLKSLDAREKFIDGFFYPDGQCQMEWVARNAGNTGGYNTNKSAFWRVIRQASRRLGVWQDGNEEDWSSRLVWSNLYKISPHDAGGNPSNGLCKIQEPGCIELLREEIREYAPEKILFLTGWNWAWPFVTPLSSERQETSGLVEASGKIDVLGHNKEIPFVVAKHPQGKPESEWVEEVISRFESVSAK